MVGYMYSSTLLLNLRPANFPVVLPVIEELISLDAKQVRLIII